MADITVFAGEKWPGKLGKLPDADSDIICFVNFKKVEAARPNIRPGQPWQAAAGYKRYCLFQRSCLATGSSRKRWDRTDRGDCRKVRDRVPLMRTNMHDSATGWVHHYARNHKGIVAVYPDALKQRVPDYVPKDHVIVTAWIRKIGKSHRHYDRHPQDFLRFDSMRMY